MLKSSRSEVQFLLYGDKLSFIRVRDEECHKLLKFLSETVAENTWQFSRVLEFIKEKWPQRLEFAVLN